MQSTIDIIQARSFLESVRQHSTVGKGIVTQIFGEANRRGEDLAQCASGVGVMQQDLLQWAFGVRDLYNADTELLLRVGEYLEGDLGVLQVAVGNLTERDFDFSGGRRPCEMVKKEVEAWLATEHALMLQQLAAEFAHVKGRAYPTKFPLLSVVEPAVSQPAWDVVQSLRPESLDENTLLRWISETGRSNSCSPEGMCSYLDKPVCLVHLLFSGRLPTAALSQEELGSLALFLGIPLAAAMAAAKQL